MISMSEPDASGVVTVTVSGKVTKEDYRPLLPKLERLLQEQGSLRFLIHLEDVAGFELGALWEDIKFDYSHQSRYGRTAIVGDRDWQAWATRLSSLFFDAEMRFFTIDEAEAADAWVRA